MRTPEQAGAAARKRYDNVWRDAFTGPDPAPYSFSLAPPSAATIIRSPAEVDAWLKSWNAWLRQHPEVSTRTKTVRTQLGDQQIYTHLEVPSTTALASLNDDTRIHLELSRERWRRLPRPDPAAVRPWLSQIVELDSHDFEILLAAVAWFKVNPHSGMTVRRVPVPHMHTKWLARHRRLVIALLGRRLNTLEGVRGTGDPRADLALSSDQGVLDADDVDPDDCELDDVEPTEIPDAELDALGLRPLPVEVDVAILDEESRAFVGGIRHLRVPVDELARLALTPRVVVIVENKEAALALSDWPGTVVIHSLGNNLSVLGQLPWLHGARLLYWGDIDRHGYTLLSRARTVLPDLASIMMDCGAVAAYEDLAVPEHLSRVDAPDDTLSEGEHAALAELAKPGGAYLRIEQERVPITHAQTAIEVCSPIPTTGRQEQSRG